MEIYIHITCACQSNPELPALGIQGQFEGLVIREWSPYNETNQPQVYTKPESFPPQNLCSSFPSATYSNDQTELQHFKHKPRSAWKS